MFMHFVTRWQGPAILKQLGMVRRQFSNQTKPTVLQEAHRAAVFEMQQERLRASLRLDRAAKEAIPSAIKGALRAPLQVSHLNQGM